MCNKMLEYYLILENAKREIFVFNFTDPIYTKFGIAYT